MLLARRESAELLHDILTRYAPRVFDWHALDHLGQHRSASECRRTAVGEKARRFDAPVRDAEREVQVVATERINLFGGSVGIG